MKFLLSQILKNIPQITKIIINSRRPLAVKAISSILLSYGIISNNEEIMPLLLYIYSLPYGNILLISIALMLLFAFKDLSGNLINFRKTVHEVFITIQSIFVFPIRILKKKKKAMMQKKVR